MLKQKEEKKKKKKKRRRKRRKKTEAKKDKHQGKREGKAHTLIVGLGPVQTPTGDNGPRIDAAVCRGMEHCKCKHKLAS